MEQPTCRDLLAKRGRVSAISFSFEISALATASLTVALIVRDHSCGVLSRVKFHAPREKIKRVAISRNLFQ
jgi:hypothetical protein